MDLDVTSLPSFFNCGEANRSSRGSLFFSFNLFDFVLVDPIWRADGGWWLLGRQATETAVEAAARQSGGRKATENNHLIRSGEEETLAAECVVHGQKDFPSSVQKSKTFFCIGNSAIGT